MTLPDHYAVYDLLTLVSKYDDTDSLWWNQGLDFFVNVNDLFDWACADLEKIESEEDIAALRQAYEDVAAVGGDHFYGSLLWACRKRGMRPQTPVWDGMKDEAVVALLLAAGPEREPGTEG